jgi:hypothetical protein
VPRKSQPTYLELTELIRKELDLVRDGKRKYSDLRLLLLKAEKHHYLSLPKGEQIGYCQTVKQKANCERIAESFLISELVSESVLAQRGWTKWLLKKIEVVPDRVTANINLYCLSKIIHLESRPDIKLIKEKFNRDRNNRKTIKPSVVTKRRQEALRWINSLQVSVPDYSLEFLVAESVRFYNEIQQSRGDFDKFCSSSDDPAFLSRLCFNFLHEQMKSYRSSLEMLFGSGGEGDVMKTLASKINLAIAAKYPDLESQIQNRTSKVSS